MLMTAPGTCIERSDLLLGGQKVLPQRLQESGFVFEFPELPTALQEILKS